MNIQKKLYTVRELTALTGVTRKTLFYYDRIHLLLPDERVGVQNHKLYTEDSCLRLKKIIEYRNAGIHLEEIRRILDGKEEEIVILQEVMTRLLEEEETCRKFIKAVRKLMERYI